MNNTIKFLVDIKNKGKRLDIFLAEKINSFTRSYLKKSIENEKVLLNQSICRSPSTKIKYKENMEAF